MSPEYPRKFDDYTSIQVVRPIDGLDSFIDKVRALSDEILGKRHTGAIQVEGREDYLTTGLPYGRVRDAGDMELTIFEKYTLPEQRSSGTYAKTKEHLRNGFKASKKQNSNANKQDRPPLAEQLELNVVFNGIAAPDVMSIEFDTIVALFRPGVRNGAYELALVPNHTTVAGRIALLDAKETHQRVTIDASRLGFPDATTMPHAKFASVREMPTELLHREVRFKQELQKLLPVSGIASAIDVK